MRFFLCVALRYIIRCVGIYFLFSPMFYFGCWETGFLTAWLSSINIVRYRTICYRAQYFRNRVFTHRDGTQRAAWKTHPYPPQSQLSTKVWSVHCLPTDIDRPILDRMFRENDINNNPNNPSANTPLRETPTHTHTHSSPDCRWNARLPLGQGHDARSLMVWWRWPGGYGQVWEGKGGFEVNHGCSARTRDRGWASGKWQPPCLVVGQALEYLYIRTRGAK